MRMLCALIEPGDAPDQSKWADETLVFRGAGASPDSGMSLTRPAVEMHGTVETAASFLTDADRGGTSGV